MSLEPLRARRPSQLRRYGSFVLFIAVMALVGFLAQFQWVGYVAILGYIVFALIKQLSARMTFTIALVLLGMVPIAVLFSNWTIAQNFAVYCFILLVFGVVLTTIELQRESKVDE